MTLVVDASVVVAALIDRGERGAWAIEVIRSEELLAPHHMPAEVANALRRAALTGVISGEAASTAHHDLLALPVQLAAYHRLAERAWALRSTVTIYDAWYVALAEAMDAALATLDARLAASPGPTCSFVLPPLELR